MICCIILFLKRSQEKPAPLSRLQTEQLKGMAILMVILGHLWVHVSKKGIALNFAGDAVAMFLLLSGYGLHLSSNKKIYNAKTYFAKRTERVMIPYWGTTITFLFLDYIILNKKYALTDLLMTFAGINVNTTTKHIDYVRWYITFILLWYCLYYFSTKILKENQQIIFLYICAGVLFVVSYYKMRFGWYQFFAFPSGCLIALKYKKVKNKFDKKEFKYLAAIISLFLLSIAIASKIMMNSLNTYTFLDEHVPSIILTFFKEINSIAVSVGLIILVMLLARLQFYSRFLAFCGSISYEMFLIHGAFLIKYDPIIENRAVVLSFLMFLIFIIVISYSYQKIINQAKCIIKVK